MRVALLFICLAILAAGGVFIGCGDDDNSTNPNLSPSLPGQIALVWAQYGCT